MTILKCRRSNGQILEIREDIENESEYMNAAYQRAAEILHGIVDISSQMQKNNIPDLVLYGYAGNILAITGRRGQGKTSTMLSISEKLKTELPGIRGGKSRKDVSFLVLDPIDPTILEADQNPLMLILSRMYLAAEEIWEKSTSGTSTDRIQESQKNQLVDRFQECLSGINAVKRGKTDHQPSLYEMQELSDSAGLKKRFYELIRELLSFGKNRENSQRYLVIQLDDTDFQIERSYEILEDIRKYLTLPNVIIMMATDLEILYDVVAQHFFDKMKTARENGLISSTELRNHTHKYLDKLIPPANIVNLPQIDTMLNQDPKSMRLQFGDEDHSILSAKDGGSLSEQVFRLLYAKTGILLIEQKTAKAFIPTTLRGLMQLLNLLAGMEDARQARQGSIGDRDKILEILGNQTRTEEKNLRLFADYFRTSWLNSKMTGDKEAANKVSISKGDHSVKSNSNPGKITADSMRSLFQKLELIEKDARYTVILEELGKCGIEAASETRSGDHGFVSYGVFRSTMACCRKQNPLPLEQAALCAVEIWLTIIWHFAVLHRQRVEIERIESESRNCTGAAVVRYQPDSLGLPHPRELDIPPKAEGKKDPVTKAMMRATSFKELNEALKTDERFCMSNLLWLLLVDQLKKGEKIVFILEAMAEQGLIFEAQQLAVQIFTNPELLDKVTETERNARNKDEYQGSASEFIRGMLKELQGMIGEIYQFKTDGATEKAYAHEQGFAAISRLLRIDEESVTNHSENHEGNELIDWVSTILRDDHIASETEKDRKQEEDLGLDFNNPKAYYPNVRNGPAPTFYTQTFVGNGKRRTKKQESMLHKNKERK